MYSSMHFGWRVWTGDVCGWGCGQGVYTPPRRPLTKCILVVSGGLGHSCLISLADDIWMRRIEIFTWITLSAHFKPPKSWKQNDIHHIWFLSNS